MDIIILIILWIVSPLLGFIVTALYLFWILRGELKKEHEAYEEYQRQLKERYK